jgi:hypothetical protein
MTFAIIAGEVLLTALLYVLYIFVFAGIFWMAVDAAKQDKFWWIVLILGMPIVGAVVYYFVEKHKDYSVIDKA